MQQHYFAESWGGTQVDAYADGGAPQGALAPASAHQVPGEWDPDREIFDEQFCLAISATTNMQCRAFRLKGEQVCHFHRRQGARKSADNGAES